MGRESERRGPCLDISTITALFVPVVRSRLLSSALLACLILSAPALARPTSTLVPPTPPDAVFGVKGGVSYSRVTGDAHGTEARMGIVAGVQLDVPTSAVLAVRGEMLYHELGARRVAVGSAYYQGLPPPVPICQDARRRYLELALLAKVRPSGSDVYWLAGPTFGVLLSRSEAYSETYDRSQYWDPDDPALWYHPNQILNAPARTSGSFLLGMGAEARLGATALLVEARYQWGLQDINRTAWFALHDRGLTVMAGVLF